MNGSFLRSLKSESGFTLVEVLISAAIFAIGFLAIAQLQMMSIHGNRTARGTTEANSLLQEKVDVLRMLPIGHADLVQSNDGDLGEPNNITLLSVVGEVGSAYADPQVEVYGNVYRVFWNVARPENGVRNVRVVVAWNEKNNNRRIFTDFVRSSQF